MRKATDCLSDSVELESIIERVLRRMMVNGGDQYPRAISLGDEISTLSSKDSVPNNIITTSSRKAGGVSVTSNLLAGEQEGNMIIELSDEIYKLEQKLASASAARKTVEIENVDLKLRLETRSKDIANITQDNGRVKTHLETKLFEQGKEISQLNRWLDDEKASHIRLSDQNEALEMTIRRQYQDLNTLDTKIQEINAKGKEKYVLVAQVNEQTTKIEQQREELANLNLKVQDTNVAKEKEIIVLKAQVELQSTRIERQCKEAATMNATVQEQNEIIDRILHGDLATVHSIDTKEQENRILSAKIEKQRKRIECLCSEMARLEAFIGAREKEDKALEGLLKRQIETIARQLSELKWQSFVLKLLGHDNAQSFSKKLHHETCVTELLTRQKMVEYQLKNIYPRRGVEHL